MLAACGKTIFLLEEARIILSMIYNAIVWSESIYQDIPYLWDLSDNVIINNNPQTVPDNRIMRLMIRGRPAASYSVRGDRGEGALAVRMHRPLGPILPQPSKWERMQTL